MIVIKISESLGTDNPDLLGIVEYGSKSFKIIKYFKTELFR